MCDVIVIFSGVFRTIRGIAQSLSVVFYLNLCLVLSPKTTSQNKELLAMLSSWLLVTSKVWGECSSMYEKNK
jgi:hypothetical protein